jgi:Flp pilus assembly protein TadB
VIALAAVGGVLAAAGVVLFVRELVGVPAATPSPTGRPGRRLTVPKVTSRRAVTLLGVPALAWAVTGWPVAAAAALVALIALPRVTGGKRSAQRVIARLDALAAWVRRVADLLAAGIGLEQALQASAQSAPPMLSEEVSRLAWRLRAGSPTDGALRAFADDINDPAGDLVAAALILAANRRGRGLARTLTGLAGTIDAEVAMRRRVEADRATPRTTVRYVTAITLVAVTALVTLDRSYMAPFGSPTGQLALAAACGLFASAFWLMHRLVTDPAPQRFLPHQSKGQP